MIFVTVGTHPQSFERLIRKIDELAESKKIRESIFAQTGYSDYKPKNFEFKKFLSLDEFNAKIKKADIIITHGGEGNIGLALKNNKRIIIVPRLKKFKEHTNDHQLELSRAIEKQGKGIGVYSVNELEAKLKEIKKFKLPVKREKRQIPLIIEEFLNREKLIA